MARIRTIKPEFWEDEVVGTLSRDARLLFLATLNMADDEGLLRWTAAYIKSQAFMYDDDVTVDGAQQLMDEVVAAGMVFQYVGGRTNQRLAFIVNFRKHQKINRPQPSKLPSPSLQNPQIRQMYGRRDGWVCGVCGAPINETPSVDERFNLSVGHVTPQSQGGTDAPSNLRATHVTCDKSRRDGVTERLNESVADVGVSDTRTSSVSGSVNDSVNDSRNHSRKRASPVVNEAVQGSLLEGKGREGNRDSATRGAEAPEPDAQAESSAQTLVAEWIDNCNGGRPPGRVIGQVAKELGVMLAEGIPYADVRTGLAAWHHRGLHPSSLASVVHETRTAGDRKPVTRSRHEIEQAATDRMFDEAMARARERDAAEAAERNGTKCVTG